MGAQIRLGRLERRWKQADLAERAGISHATLRKIEQGNLGVALGAVFEAATLVGVPLFHPDPERRRLEARTTEARLAVVPSRARRAVRDVDVNF